MIFVITEIVCIPTGTSLALRKNRSMRVPIYSLAPRTRFGSAIRVGSETGCHTLVAFKVKIGNGEYIVVKGNGIMAIESTSCTKLIRDVLFMPNISQNLLSVGQLLEKGFKVIFETNQCLIKDAEGKDMFKVKMKGKSNQLWSLDPLDEEQSFFSTTKINVEI